MGFIQTFITAPKSDCKQEQRAFIDKKVSQCEEQLHEDGEWGSKVESMLIKSEEEMDQHIANSDQSFVREKLMPLLKGGKLYAIEIDHD